MMYELAAIIKAARNKFDDMLLREPGAMVPVEMTAIENRCFHECIELIKKTLPRLDG